ncbi:MAG: hypothetical protein COW89_10240 [Nitrospinae bacterium CG22_combo_CG10-13_8_21_14_all_47_10]|nr:MAG: hypothetical protein COW89_10240 [Nitrospinae bacterium CG22_combo_CG10-13_8_21_14_all_47_10]
MNDLRYAKVFSEIYNSVSGLENGSRQIHKCLIKRRKIPAILVTRTRIVNPCLSPDFARLWTVL